MSQHTPGPWRQSPLAADAVIADLTTDPDGVKYYGGYVIAESIRPGDLPLIAAAPDLLAACQAALPIVTLAGNSYADDVAAQVRAALAKAQVTP